LGNSRGSEVICADYLTQRYGSPWARSVEIRAFFGELPWQHSHRVRYDPISGFSANASATRISDQPEFRLQLPLKQNNHPMCQSSSVSSAQQSAMNFQIGVVVAKKAQDATKAVAQAALESLGNAAQSAKAPGLGDQFDGVG
jgi:hypothetical protein